MGRSKITVYVDDKVLASLDAQALKADISRTALISNHLERLTKDQAEVTGMDLVVPRLEEALRKETSRLAKRLSELLRHTALEAAVSRSLLHSELAHEYGESAANAIHDAAYKASVERLRQPIDAWGDTP